MEPANESVTVEPQVWTAAERFAFRAVVAYFGVFFVGSLLDSGPGPRRRARSGSSTATEAG